MKARSPELASAGGMMRIYRKSEAGEAVYIADCLLPRVVCDAIDSGREAQYELPPIFSHVRRIGSDSEPDYGATVTNEHIMLEPYRLYRNGVLVEMGAMIADPSHVRMLADNIQQRTAAREEVSAISVAWQERE